MSFRSSHLAIFIIVLSIASGKIVPLWLRIVFRHPTFAHFQRFYPGSKRMSITPDFIRFLSLLCTRVVRLAFLFLLFCGIKSRKFCIFSPNLTQFFQNICIFQKKALPLHRNLQEGPDGEPTVNRQSRLMSSLCQAKNGPFFVQYILYYIFIYNIQFNTLFYGRNTHHISHRHDSRQDERKGHRLLLHA